MIEKPKPRPRWCPKCKARKDWGKMRLLGARSGFRACLDCGTRTQSRQPVKQGGKPKRPRSERKQLRDRADELWREIIKRPGRCRNCGRTGEEVKLEAAHGFSRVYERTRWRLDNGWPLCTGEHSWFTYRPEKWKDWLIERYAEQVSPGFACSDGELRNYQLSEAQHRYQEMKALAYSSETNPMTLDEIRAAISVLEAAAQVA